MNYAVRNHELRRIEHDNIKIVKKIYFIDSYIGQKNQEASFSNHLMLSDNLAKIKRRRMPTIDGKLGSLPPIT
jgi:hypothetical protein